jgi:hypothetical protein
VDEQPDQLRLRVAPLWWGRRQLRHDRRRQRTPVHAEHVRRRSHDPVPGHGVECGRIDERSVGRDCPGRGRRQANTAAPAISGTPQEGSTLSGSNGTWANGPTKYDYAWLRCDNKGGSCATINGANKNTYVLTSGDVNNTVRFRVTASNSAGNNTAASAPTAVITKNRGGGCPPGGNPDQVANINSPARLLVDTLQSDPQVVSKGTRTLTVRFHVTSTCGGPVQGALVYSTATPYNQWAIPPEASTGADGWAQLSMNRLSGYPATPRQRLLVMFVRARKQGEDLLGGISTRRLVSFPVNLRQ